MALNQDRIDFIKKYRDAVINSTQGTGYFPSVKMAQMIIESADRNGKSGKGITFVKANNAFGIKANKNWKGDKMAFNTPKDGQPVNYFRVYPTIQDSIADHTTFLKVNPRYTKAGVFDAKNPAEQLLALQKSGYSESPVYAVELAKIIKNYGLEEMDKIQGVVIKKKNEIEK
jgi:flagellum-specific peptidoglycan hydrolase FlgJ